MITVTPPGGAIADLTRREPVTAAVLGAAVFAFGALALVRHDPRLYAFLVVLAVGLAAVAITDRTARYSSAVLRALAGLGIAHLSGGLLPSPTGAVTFYETWLVPGVVKYDQLVHLSGSAIATVAAWQLLGRHLDPVRSTATFQATMAAGLGLGKGAVNEVVEFLSAEGLTGLAVGGGTNTGWDLTFNLAGVALAALWLVRAGVDRHT